MIFDLEKVIARWLQRAERRMKKREVLMDTDRNEMLSVKQIEELRDKLLGVGFWSPKLWRQINKLCNLALKGSKEKA